MKADCPCNVSRRQDLLRCTCDYPRAKDLKALEIRDFGLDSGTHGIEETKVDVASSVMTLPEVKTTGC